MKNKNLYIDLKYKCLCIFTWNKDLNQYLSTTVFFNIREYVNYA